MEDESRTSSAKVGNQIDRKIVDGVIAQVFESAQHRAFAGAAHSRDDDESGASPRLASTGDGAGGGGSARFALSFACTLLARGIRLFPRGPLAVAPLLAHPQRLLFELTNSRVNSREKIGIGAFADEIVVDGTAL